MLAAEGDGALGRICRRLFRHAGAARRSAPSPERPEKRRRPRRFRSTQPAQPAAKQKLSFKDKHALQTLPATIDRLHAEIGPPAAKRLADPGLFGRDAAAFNRTAADLERAEAELAAAEEEWLRLELLRETVEG